MDLVVLPFTSFVEAARGVVTQASALDSAQCKCLSKYLQEIGAGSVVVEPRYTDGGYMVDYANYYARCHDGYGKFTHRLHFFRLPPDALRAAFDGAFASGSVDSTLLQAQYLGFVVIKPLPQTIIGRTCLITYQDKDIESGRLRRFPIKRRYEVHLLGLTLSVDSIAFQEQDNEVAACSTAAIWYTLHGLTRKFTTQEIPSPFQITNAAFSATTRRAMGEVTRKFPTSGLGLEQIEALLRSYGLECIVCGVQPQDTSRELQEYVAAYVRGGAPMIVVGHLYASRDPAHGFQRQGFHAVTALGYACSKTFRPGNWSSRIERLFAHDDNVGPFSSFRFETCEAGRFEDCLRGGPPAELETLRAALAAAPDGPGSGGGRDDQLTSYLSNTSGNAQVGMEYRKLVPAYFLIPVNPKVRFPYETVHLFAARVARNWQDDARLRYGPETQGLPPIAWSIRLQDVSSYKRSLARNTGVDRQHAYTALLVPMPKYLWSLRFTTQGADGRDECLLDLLFDATDLRQSGGVIAVMPFQSAVADTFVSVLMAWVHAWYTRGGLRADPGTDAVMRKLYACLQGAPERTMGAETA